jgi:hypothetical protein
MDWVALAACPPVSPGGRRTRAECLAMRTFRLYEQITASSRWRSAMRLRPDRLHARIVCDRAGEAIESMTA